MDITARQIVLKEPERSGSAFTSTYGQTIFGPPRPPGFEDTGDHSSCSDQGYQRSVFQCLQLLFIIAWYERFLFLSITRFYGGYSIGIHFVVLWMALANICSLLITLWFASADNRFSHL
jgi:hypothetical protein